ncbi:MAG: anti-sigma factor RsiW, partial [Myxococcota bacterium]
MSQETEQNGWTNADLFRRDGHLTDLTLERFDAEPMPEDQTQLVQEHLSACARCTELLAEVRAQDPLPSLTVAAPEVSVPTTAATATPESAPASNVIAFPIRPRHLGMAATLLAAAAALFVVLRPGPELVVASPGGDGIRLRGSAVTMEVILDDQSHGRILEQNDVVHPGDRIG